MIFYLVNFRPRLEVTHLAIAIPLAIIRTAA